MSELNFTYLASLRKPAKLRKIKNQTGRTFGRLLVLGLLGMSPDSKHRAIWLCKCSCGQVCTAVGDALVGGKTTSCGCYKFQRIREASRTHGMRRSREYKKHSNMIARCFNPNNIQASDYSQRGITVCEYLRDFASFFKDLGFLPSPEHSTDRPDNHGNNSCGHCEQCVTNGWPKNIRWATKLEQAANKRSTHFITANGETLHLAAWVRRSGRDHASILSALERGWTPEEAVGLVEHPPKQGFTAKGKFAKSHQLKRAASKNR